MALVLLICWWSVRPLSSQLESVKILATQAAAGDTNAVAALRVQGSNAVPGLVKLLRWRDPGLLSMAWKIGPRLPASMSSALLSRTGPLDAARVRLAAVNALGLLGAQGEGAVPALLEELRNPESYEAMAAATALSRIGQASVPGLTRALSDKDPVVRHAAAYGLGEIGPNAEQSVPDLIQNLADADPSVRSSTAYSLMMIGYPSVAELSNLIDHADQNAREAAVTEFIRFYRSLLGVTRPLIKMAHAEPAASRRQALQALGAIRAADDATINTFIGALSDPVVEVRLTGLKALTLVAWRAQAAVGGLRKCLQDPSPAVREWAARVLGAIGPSARAAVGDLRLCFLDNEPAVRDAAHEALARIEPGEGASPVTREH